MENQLQNTAPLQAPAQPDAQVGSPQAIPISGRFDQYRSSYWAAAIAALGARYFPRPFLRPSMEGEGFFTKHLYSGFAGLVMEGVTAVFAYTTWKDMRNIFAEALAWEFNKKPEDVNFNDFRRSKNTMVQQTLNNYVRYNLRRAAVNLTFFAPYIFKKPFEWMTKNAAPDSMWRPEKWHAESGADFALGTNALYLLSDVFSRKATPFEAMQATIDFKINHTESYADKIAATDLLDIYERHAANGPIQSFTYQRGTPQWEESMQVFQRMADLMNQTYNNDTRKEQANFTMGKFIYLVGNGLIQPSECEQTRTLIEVSNRYGIDALKQAVNSMTQGGTLQQALSAYPIAPGAEPPAPKKHTELAQPPSAYTDKAKHSGASHSLAI